MGLDCYWHKCDPAKFLDEDAADCSNRLRRKQRRNPRQRFEVVEHASEINGHQHDSMRVWMNGTSPWGTK